MTTIATREFGWLPLLLKIMKILVLAGLAIGLAALLLSLVQSPGDAAGHWQLGTAVVTTGLAWVIVDRLLRLVRRVGGGDAFAPENARYLRQIGLTLLVFQLLPFVGSILPAAAPAWLRSNQVDGGTTLAIIVMLILAEALRQGAILRDDARLTV